MSKANYISKEQMEKFAPNFEQIRNILTLSTWSIFPWSALVLKQLILSRMSLFKVKDPQTAFLVLVVLSLLLYLNCHLPSGFTFKILICLTILSRPINYLHITKSYQITFLKEKNDIVYGKVILQYLWRCIAKIQIYVDTHFMNA